MDEDEAIHNIIKVYLAQMDSAVHISKILCEHSDDNEMTGDHIICGLIYRLMVPMTDDHITESLDNADNILNGLDESESDEESDEELEEPINCDKKRKLKMNNCQCEICSKCRECIDGYEAYETYDPMVTRFKDSIRDTCVKHNIFI